MNRSWLFCPGGDEAKMAKACTAGADAVIIDLEDSVAEQAKSEARKLAAEYVRRRGVAQQPELWVRINPIATLLGRDDLASIVPAAPSGIVLPKTSSGADVEACDRILTDCEMASGLRVGGIQIVAIATETAQSIFALNTYASGSDRLAGLTWGAEDLPVAVGASGGRWDDGSFTDLCRLARSLCLAGAAVAGVPAFETVYPAFRDLDGLRDYAHRGRYEGFAGMMAIHPAQVPIINAAFTPTASELDHARRVVAAFAANPDAGVVALNGRMLDAPHLAQARRLLAMVPHGAPASGD
ncbi:MAG: CoA ester lyase [Rhodospirillaceae bacterium]|nr:CoA ester lyase [Rhodospirillaceae bacterium]